MIPLPIIQSNSLLEMEESLPLFLSPLLTQNDALAFCAFHRKAGIAMFFMTGLAKELQEALFKSTQAFIHALERLPGERKATGRFEPFFDALACNHTEGARRIAALARTTCNPDWEYEEDFLYMRCLMDLEQGQGTALDPALQRWDELVKAGVGTDFRLDICRALRQRDARAFNFNLGTWMGEVKQEAKSGFRRGGMLEEDLLTLGKLSVEGLGLARLAEKAGIAVDREFPLMPAAARIGNTTVTLDPESWMP